MGHNKIILCICFAYWYICIAIHTWSLISSVLIMETWWLYLYPSMWLQDLMHSYSSRIMIYITIFVLLCPGGKHDDVIKWKHFPHYWPFRRGNHRSPVSSPHKGQWRRALMFSLIFAWINSWVNNGETGDLRRHRAHYDVTLMHKSIWFIKSQLFALYWLFIDFSDHFPAF